MTKPNGINGNILKLDMPCFFEIASIWEFSSNQRLNIFRMFSSVS